MKASNKVLFGLFKVRRKVKELAKRGPTLSGLEKIDEDVKHLQSLWQGVDCGAGEKQHKIDRVSDLFSQIEEIAQNQKEFLSRIAPALYPVYLQLLRIRTSVYELKKANDMYTCYDVAPLQLKLIELEEEYIENGDFIPDKEEQQIHAKQLCNILLSGQAILRIFLEQSYRQTRWLLQATDVFHVDDSLRVLYNQLHSIRRRLERMKFHRYFTEEDIIKVQKSLTEISSSRIDGKFLADPESKQVPKGQAILSGLLEQNFEICHELLLTYNPISASLKPIHSELLKMKSELEVISQNSRFLIDPVDVLKYYRRLVEIDETKGNGALIEKTPILPRSSSFLSAVSSSGVSVDTDDTEMPKGQSVIHYLLHKCYRLVYNILTSAEPVDNSIKNVQNQLLALRRCLQELKNSHQGSPDNEMNYCLSPLVSRYDPVLRYEDLIPIQLKLSAIDKMRVDGKFLNKVGEVPPGQSTLHSLLNECYDFLHELMDIAEENEKRECEVLEEEFSSDPDFDDEIEKCLGKANLPVVPIIPVS